MTLSFRKHPDAKAIFLHVINLVPLYMKNKIAFVFNLDRKLLNFGIGLFQ